MICVALAPRDTDDAFALMGNARVGGADLVELRLDLFENGYDLERLVGERPLPLVVTLRPPRQGGRADIADAERLEVLVRAAALGAEHVDLEWDAATPAAITALRGAGAKVIVSRHAFSDMPPDLPEWPAQLWASGADVVKIVGMAHSPADLEGVFAVLARAERPTVAIAMGEVGLPTRLLAPRFPGCYFTFAAPDGAGGTAPGQVALREMRQVYRVDRLGMATEVHGVLDVGDWRGRALAVNEAFAREGRDAVAVPFPGVSEPREIPGLPIERWVG